MGPESQSLSGGMLPQHTLDLTDLTFPGCFPRKSFLVTHTCHALPSVPQDLVPYRIKLFLGLDLKCGF